MPALARAPLAKGAIVLCVVAGVVALALPYFDPSSDGRYALAWGDQIAHGNIPNFPLQPARHPLEVGVATLLGPLGASAAFDVWTALFILAFLGLLYAAFRLGTALWSPTTGILAAAILVTRPDLVADAARCYRDVPFAAFVLAAAALAVEGPTRNWWKVLALLGVAGLIRPDAWPLSILFGAYLLFMRPVGDAGERISPPAVIALALAPPLVWAAFGLATTGDALDAYRSVQGGRIAALEAAGFAPETGGGGSVPHFYASTLCDGIPGLIGWPLTALGGLAAGWACWRRFRRRAAELWDPVLAVAVALIALLCVYAGLWALGLPAAPRFLIAAAAILVVLGVTLVALRRNRAVALVLVAVGLFLLATLPGDISDIGTVLRSRNDLKTAEARLIAMAHSPRVQHAVAHCERLSFASYDPSLAGKGRAIVALELGLDPTSIPTRRHPPTKRGAAAFTRGLGRPKGARGSGPHWGFVSRCASGRAG